MKQKLLNLIQAFKAQPKKTALILIPTILLLILLFPDSNQPQVTASAPTDLRPIPDQTTLNTDFYQPLSQAQQQQINLQTNPHFDANLNWPNNKQLQVTPQQPLVPNTTYSISVLYKNQTLHQYSFTTNPYSSEELESQAQLQTQDDHLFSQALLDIHQQYPWYQHIPITSDTYSIVFDFDQQKFRIRLLGTPTDTLKSQALQALKDLNIDLDTYGYYFIEPSSQFQKLINQ